MAANTEITRFKTDLVATGKNATRTLAQYAAGLKYESLPTTIVELTKQCVLDTLGVSIGASTLSPEAAIVAEYVKDMSGKPESTLLGFGGKAPASWAAFVNGSLGHMLDYDGVNRLGSGGHVGITTVPVAFAVAEKIGGVSGRDLLTAIACGTDVQTRLAQSVNIPDWAMAEGWFPAQLLGYISGAATAGKLLGLDAEQMENAFGIAFNQLSGSRQMAVGAATHMRSMQGGFSGQGAVLAAGLAQRGIIGSKEILEGRFGLYKTYVRSSQPVWRAIFDGLGTSFPLIDVHGFKVWPACGMTRPTNAATLELRQEFNLRPEEIEAITVVGGTSGTQFLCEPLEVKRRPSSSIDGKFSIPFTTAVMMVKGSVTLRDYTDSGLHDPAILSMADRVSYRKTIESENIKNGALSTSADLPAVEIRTKDGRVLIRQPNGVPGDATNPVDIRLLEAKFRDCVSFSANPIPIGNIDRAIVMIQDLETIPDATDVVSLLS